MHEDGEGSGGEDASVGAVGGGRAGGAHQHRPRASDSGALGSGRGERELGFGGYQLPDTFFDELPEEELSAWEGA